MRLVLRKPKVLCDLSDILSMCFSNMRSSLIVIILTCSNHYWMGILSNFIVICCLQSLRHKAMAYISHMQQCISNLRRSQLKYRVHSHAVHLANCVLTGVPLEQLACTWITCISECTCNGQATSMVLKEVVPIRSFS